LLTRYSGLRVSLELLLAVVAGLIGGGIVFLFLTKVLISDEECMDPADYEMVGVLGRISSSIRAGGTGELIYSQAGTRRVCGARGDEGNAIAKGTEVVVTRCAYGARCLAKKTFPSKKTRQRADRNWKDDYESHLVQNADRAAVARACGHGPELLAVVGSPPRAHGQPL
jgi:hypothetical protein